jgi:hypothetical protein
LPPVYNADMSETSGPNEVPGRRRFVVNPEGLNWLIGKNAGYLLPELALPLPRQNLPFGEASTRIVQQAIGHPPDPDQPAATAE